MNKKEKVIEIIRNADDKVVDMIYHFLIKYYNKV